MTVFYFAVLANLGLDLSSFSLLLARIRALWITSHNFRTQTKLCIWTRPSTACCTSPYQLQTTAESLFVHPTASAREHQSALTNSSTETHRKGGNKILWSGKSSHQWHHHHHYEQFKSSFTNSGNKASCQLWIYFIDNNNFPVEYARLTRFFHVAHHGLTQYWALIERRLTINGQ